MSKPLTEAQALARFDRLITRAKRQHAKKQQEAAQCATRSESSRSSPERAAA
jgi:hypothetical protein